MDLLTLTLRDASQFVHEQSWLTLGVMTVVGLGVLLFVANAFAAGSRRRASTTRTNDLQADREADLKNHDGPPRFNG
jgi:hypothetical protein